MNCTGMMPPTRPTRVQNRLLYRRHPNPLAVGHDQHCAAPEELCPQGGDQRRDAQANHDQPVQEPGQQARQQAGDEAEPHAERGVGLAQRQENHGVDGHAPGHDGREGEIDFLGDDHERQGDRHQGIVGRGRHEGVVDVVGPERQRRAPEKERPDQQEDADDGDLQGIPAQPSRQTVALGHWREWRTLGYRIHRARSILT
jgi:hypothetical protein